MPSTFKRGNRTSPSPPSLEEKRKKVIKMKDWTDYQNKTYNNDVCKLLVYFLNNYKISNAIDLGCGSGNETVYMAKKGIKVTAIDRQLNKDFILNRLDDSEKKNVSFLEQDFETVKLNKTDAIMSFFSIPFCNPQHFETLWNNIYDSLNDNGYFVGQLIGERDAWKDSEFINTFTMKEVKAYLKRYKILKLDEIEYIRESDNKKWHFYNIIAKKEMK